MLFNSIYLLLFISILLSTILPQTIFTFGGDLGIFMKNGLIRLGGFVGIIGLLIFMGFAIIFINYNIHDILAVFKSPATTFIPKENVDNKQNIQTNHEPSVQEVKNPTNSNVEIIEPIVELSSQKIPSNTITSAPEDIVVVINAPTNEDSNFEIIDKNELSSSGLTSVLKPKNTGIYPSTKEEDFNANLKKGDLKLEINFDNTEPISQPQNNNFQLLEKAAKTDFIPEVPYDPNSELSQYKYPTIDLLDVHTTEKANATAEELESYKNLIIVKLREHSIEIQSISATIGPTVTLFEIIPAPGIRISKIKNLEDDIALSLAALGIRIIAPIPGKGTIGIEVPNIKKTIVGIRTLLSSEKFTNSNFSLPIALGKKINNENFIVDLATMPHLLMAGATGQGKSVGINAILVSLLYKKHPSQLKFVLVDPKKVELSLYKTIEMHFLAKLPGEEEAIITDTKKVINTLNALCIEMDNRYDLLKASGCRNIKEYNAKFIDRKLSPKEGHQFLPFIVLVVDEFADLIMTAGKEVEMPIARLAQLARAIGIHLIIATQRPSVNIITGTIKANFPARVAFKVSSKIDSRTILDMGGADQLIGRGDMLVNYNGDLTRVQCALVDTPEVERVCEFIGQQIGYPQPFYLPEYIDEKELENDKNFDMQSKDSLFEDAAKLIVQIQLGSTSSIQRKMKLGYNRAGRIMDQLEAAGIVGPGQGSKPREVKIKTEYELLELLRNLH